MISSWEKRECEREIHLSFVLRATIRHVSVMRQRLMWMMVAIRVRGWVNVPAHSTIVLR